MISITKDLISCNTYPGANIIKCIVIHDTGNTDKGSNAKANRDYFNSPEVQASAHYIVDDKTIIQAVNDLDGAWHCGDGHGAYGITNSNSIGVEICINADGDYAKAIRNAQDLVVSLLGKYNLQCGNVVRHYDASRKNCPGTMNADGKWTGWTLFQNALFFNYSVTKLVAKGIISSPDYWLNTTPYNPDYVKVLIQNMANKL